MTYQEALQRKKIYLDENEVEEDRRVLVCPSNIFDLKEFKEEVTSRFELIEDEDALPISRDKKFGVGVFWSNGSDVTFELI